MSEIGEMVVRRDWGVRFIVVTVVNGSALWIAQCRTRRGADASARYHRKLTPEGKVIVLDMQDVMNWHNSGIAELEALFRLEDRR